jgi:hypothetical protein
MSRSLPYLLLAVKVALFAWGFLGLLEYFFFPSLAFGLQNGRFPHGTQLLHWLLLLLVGSIFVVGFVLRWRHTPFATITMYATLATLCFVETVDFGAFGGGPGRYFIMAAEYAVYVILSIYLLRSQRIRERFQPVQPVAAAAPER